MIIRSRCLQKLQYAECEDSTGTMAESHSESGSTMGDIDVAQCSSNLFIVNYRLWSLNLLLENSCKVQTG